MSGPFDWGGDGKSDGAGTKQNLPRHIERMNMGTRPPKMKQSGDGNNLPWGGQPKEKDKAYMSGPPKDKGSMLNKLGERGGARGTKSLPGMGKAMSGHSAVVKSKAQGIGKKK
jgi:hypothetical protein